MDFIWDSIGTALRLIAGLDPDVVSAVSTSVLTALASTALAATLGVPLGTAIGMKAFRGKRAVVTTLNTLLSMPTVVMGLLLYGVLSRQGPGGRLGLLFSPTALVIGQACLALPLITSYAVSAVQGADVRIVPTALTLGAGPFQAAVLLVREVRFAMMAAVIAGFGRVISEVGLAMMLGGNIRGYTRTMTTAIALETSKGEFGFGVALGLILMTVALAVNLGFNRLQQRRGA